MNVSFLLTETRLGDIRFQKWGGRGKQTEKRIRALAITRSSAVPFSARAKVYGRKQMTSDNWRCAHSFCGLWHLGCIMRAIFIAYTKDDDDDDGQEHFLFFSSSRPTTELHVLSKGRQSPCLTSLDNPVFLDSHSFFGQCLWQLSTLAVTTSMRFQNSVKTVCQDRNKRILYNSPAPLTIKHASSGWALPNLIPWHTEKMMMMSANSHTIWIIVQRVYSERKKICHFLFLNCLVH